MEQTMTWEDAVRLVEQITASADSGNWHAHVAAVEQGYAVRYANTIRRRRIMYRASENLLPCVTLL